MRPTFKVEALDVKLCYQSPTFPSVIDSPRRLAAHWFTNITFRMLRAENRERRLVSQKVTDRKRKRERKKDDWKIPPFQESFIRPFSIRLLSVSYPYAIHFVSFCNTSYSYPYSVFRYHGYHAIDGMVRSYRSFKLNSFTKTFLHFLLLKASNC